MSINFDRWSNIILYEPSKNERLVREIKFNDYNDIKSSLDQGADPNYYSENERLPVLFVAAKYGDEDIFNLILDHSDINVHVTDGGRTPISRFVVISNYHKSLDKLIDKGIDINYTDKDGRSLLLLAIEHQHFEIIKSLLEAGAKYDNDTVEALIGNITDRIEELIELMFSDHYQSPSAEDVKEWLVSSVYAENVNALKRFLMLFPEYGQYLAHYQGDNSNTLIHNIDDLEITEILLKLGADPNAKRILNGNTKLHMLAKHNTSKIELCKLLLKYGADLNLKNHDGQTVTQIAEETGADEMLSIFNAVEDLKEPDL